MNFGVLASCLYSYTVTQALLRPRIVPIRLDQAVLPIDLTAHDIIIAMVASATMTIKIQSTLDFRSTFW